MKRSTKLRRQKWFEREIGRREKHVHPKGKRRRGEGTVYQPKRRALRSDYFDEVPV